MSKGTVFAAIDALFYPLTQGNTAVQMPAVFLNARYHPALDDFPAGGIFLQQYFKPYAAELQERGFPVSSEVRMAEEAYACVFILLPKNMDEARFLIAQGLCFLRRGGVLFCAGENDAGGMRIKKILYEFGMIDIQDISKNKARTAWGRKGDNLNEEALAAALAGGERVMVPATGFIAQAGLFGWNKIDKGSALLAQCLPGRVDGVGADFGCGYGFLSAHILKQCKGIQSLTCIDADFRALRAVQNNLENQTRGVPVKYLWEDLTRANPNLGGFDWIVMNPPFHEGKDSDSGIGVRFIATANQALRTGGTLWMVANSNLPYEEVLKKNFSSVQKKFEGEGFKVFCAVK